MPLEATSSDEPIVIGCKAIARAMFGHERFARRINYLSNLNGKRRLPTFYVGSRIAIRLSILEAWIEAMEIR